MSWRSAPRLFALVALLLATAPGSARAQSAAPASRPTLTLDIDACAGVARTDVARLVALELGADIVDQPDGGTTRTTVRCAPPVIVLHVDDPLTGKSLDRSIDLGVVPAGARARLLALALAELVTASWSELVTQPSPSVPPASPAPPDRARNAAIETLHFRSVAPSPIVVTASSAPTEAAPIEVRAAIPPPRHHRRSHAQSFPTVDGSIGLLHTATTDPAPRLGVRAGLFVGYVEGQIVRFDSRTPVTPDHSSRLTGVLTAGFSPMRYLDLHAAVRLVHSETDADPARSITTFGDGAFGATGLLPIVHGFTLGADASVVTQSGDHGIALDATGANFRTQSTFDLQQLGAAIPMRLHVNMGYLWDNSAVGVQALEAQRAMNTPGYSPIDCALPPTSDPNSPRNLDLACQQQVTAFERFAWNIRHADRWYASIAIEGWHPRLAWLRAFAEYAIDIPVVRSGYVCFTLPTNANDHDRCLALTDQFAADPPILTLGARALPPQLRGVGVVVALDVATPLATVTVRELAPVAPWTAWFGVAYVRPVSH